MTTQWRLDGTQFTVALAALGRDRMPYPLRFRADGATAEAHHRLKLQAAQQLSNLAEPALYDTLAVLHEPETRVEIKGFTDQVVIRMHAGVRGQLAALAIQLPSLDPTYGLDVLLYRSTATTLAAQIVGSLPKLAGGVHRPFTARESDLTARGDSFMVDPLHRDPGSDVKRFFNRDRSGFGEITVCTGPAYDNRPTDGKAMLWLDYPGDGRYLLEHRNSDFTVTPAAVDTFLARLQQLLGADRRATWRARA